MKSNDDKKMMRHSFSSKETGAQGRSLIERIERQLDKLEYYNLNMENLKTVNNQKHGNPVSYSLVLAKGRAEGLAAALSILRSSSVREEFSRSDKRLKGNGI